MLMCPACGTQNALGRVFCSQCGGKLDLTAMTSEAVAESVRPSWFKSHWKKLLVLFLLLLVGMVVLAAIPMSKPIGQAGKPVPGRNLQRDIGYLERSANKKRTWTEEAVNGYLDHVAKHTIKAGVSVDIEKGWCRVRMVRKLGKLDLKFYEVDVSISYDLKCVPRGGRLFVRGAKIGMMPLFPPFKTMVVKDVHKRLSSLKEWKTVSSLSQITMADDKVTVVYKKRK